MTGIDAFFPGEYPGVPWGLEIEGDMLSMPIRSGFPDDFPPHQSWVQCGLFENDNPDTFCRQVSVLDHKAWVSSPMSRRLNARNCENPARLVLVK